MKRPNGRRSWVELSALALCAALACACGEAGNESEGDGGTDVDSDSDTDADGDSDGDTDCWEDSHCTPFCEPGGEVDGEPGGIPAEVDPICGAAESPVVSTESAVVQLSTNGGQDAAIGFIQIPDELHERVVGLPEIGFTREGDDDGSTTWAIYAILDIEDGEGGFSFRVEWSQNTQWVGCDDYGDHWAVLLCRVTFSMACTDADGGVSGDAGSVDGGEEEIIQVEAVTHLQWCYAEEEGSTPGWYSSGEVCPYSCFFDWYTPCM